MTHSWKSTACFLAIVMLAVSPIAIAQHSDKPAAEGVVYLQNVSGGNLGLAAVLVRTQEFGAKVAGRAEAKGIAAEVKADIADHLSKYVTVIMPPPHEARLLAFEVRGCSKESASALAQAVAAAYLAKLRENRIETNMAAVKAVSMELDSRTAEREQNIKKLAALKPADIPFLSGSGDTLRYRMSALAQEQMKLEATKAQADQAMDALKRQPASLSQVRAALENDSILAELRRQKDALAYATTPPKDAEAAAKQTADIANKIEQRTKEVTEAKVAALKVEAKEQQDAAAEQLIKLQERVESERAKAKGLEETLQKMQVIQDRQQLLNQMISRLEDRLSELRIQADSQQDMPRYLGKSLGD